MLGNYLRKFGLLLSFGYLFLFVKGSLGRNTLASKEVRIVNICGKTKKKKNLPQIKRQFACCGHIHILEKEICSFI